MKILFITDLYPIKSDEKHTPRTLHNFVIEWIRQGHSVDVIKPNFILNSFLRGKKHYSDGFYEYEGVKIFNVNYHSPFLFNVENKLKNINVSSYDFIIAHMPAGIIFANKLAMKYNKQLICGVHSSDIEVLTNPIYKFYFKSQLKNAFQNAKKIACRSFVLQKKFCEIMPELADKTFVAPSGINEMQNGEEIKMQRAADKFRVLTCANLIKRKNIDKLILAMKELEEFELTVIGEGKEGKKLQRLSDHNTKFLEHQSNKKVLEEMQKSDIFILPSVNETFGMVYLEAMAAGCVTVCTKGDGIDGIIKDGENGFLCEPTIEGIKETLLRIKNHEDLKKIKENSLETIKNYSPEICAEKYLQKISE